MTDASKTNVYTLRVLLTSFLGFAALEGLLFHSGWYASILNPDSSTGSFERVLWAERQRKLDGPNQVIGIGDSRMALTARVANELHPETGYTFASAGLGGASPRVWYYLLRDMDPEANRYAAVVITLTDYDDAELWEHHADRYYDLRFLIARLRLSDAWELPRSFDTLAYQWEALRTIVFRGSAYNTDFQDLLGRPGDRFRSVEMNRRDGATWMYEFVTADGTMEGVSIDWNTRTVKAPPDRTPAQIAAYERMLSQPLPPDQGEHSKYLRRWLGKIREHYRQSRTRLIFVRLPRGPLVRPDLPPTNPRSSVRQFAEQPGVTLVDEHLFDFLEEPRMFLDELHLNRTGLDQFSRRMAREARRILGPPR